MTYLAFFVTWISIYSVKQVTSLKEGIYIFEDSFNGADFISNDTISKPDFVLSPQYLNLIYDNSSAIGLEKLDGWTLTNTGVAILGLGLAAFEVLKGEGVQIDQDRICQTNAMVHPSQATNGRYYGSGYTRLETFGNEVHHDVQSLCTKDGNNDFVTWDYTGNFEASSLKMITFVWQQWQGMGWFGITCGGLVAGTTDNHKVNIVFNAGFIKQFMEGRVGAVDLSPSKKTSTVKDKSRCPSGKFTMTINPNIFDSNCDNKEYSEFGSTSCLWNNLWLDCYNEQPWVTDIILGRIQPNVRQDYC
jgi:hypothetical protein